MLVVKRGDSELQVIILQSALFKILFAVGKTLSWTNDSFPWLKLVSRVSSQ